MTRTSISAIALAIGFAFSTGAMAQNMSKSDYTQQKDAIAAQFKAAKAGCDGSAGNAKDICVAKAEGGQMIAKAELEASYKPTQKSRYEVRAANADAAYLLAKQECDDKAGNAKDVCMKEAKAAQTAAKADARAKMKISKANATADEKSADAKTVAREQSIDARRDAAEEKRNAAYQVAKEKCDAFAGDAKATCLTEAKAQFDKS
jgi:hypothetical protein